MHSVLQEETISNGRQVFINVEGAGIWSITYIEERAAHIGGGQYDAATNRYIRSFGGVNVLPGAPSLNLIEHYINHGIHEYQRGKADGREEFKAEVRAMFAGDD